MQNWETSFRIIAQNVLRLETNILSMKPGYWWIYVSIARSGSNGMECIRRIEFIRVLFACEKINLAIHACERVRYTTVLAFAGGRNVGRKEQERQREVKA